MPAHRGQLPDSLAAASGEPGSDLISPKVGFVPQLLRDRNPQRAPACPVDCGFSAAVLNLASDPKVCAFLALDSVSERSLPCAKSHRCRLNPDTSACTRTC